MKGKNAQAMAYVYLGSTKSVGVALKDSVRAIFGPLKV